MWFNMHIHLFPPRSTWLDNWKCRYINLCVCSVNMNAFVVGFHCSFQQYASRYASSFRFIRPQIHSQSTQQSETKLIEDVSYTRKNHPGCRDLSVCSIDKTNKRIYNSFRMPDARARAGHTGKIGRQWNKRDGLNVFSLLLCLCCVSGLNTFRARTHRDSQIPNWINAWRITQ